MLKKNKKRKKKEGRMRSVGRQKKREKEKRISIKIKSEKRIGKRIEIRSQEKEIDQYRKKKSKKGNDFQKNITSYQYSSNFAFSLKYFPVY